MITLTGSIHGSVPTIIIWLLVVILVYSSFAYKLIKYKIYLFCHINFSDVNLCFLFKALFILTSIENFRHLVLVSIRLRSVKQQWVFFFHYFCLDIFVVRAFFSGFCLQVISDINILIKTALAVAGWPNPWAMPSGCRINDDSG